MNANTLPELSCRYGAPMGRVSEIAEFPNQKIFVQHVPLHDGGYDSGGAYWGEGQPIFWYHSDDSATSAFIRADSFEEAKSKILNILPSSEVSF